MSKEKQIEEMANIITSADPYVNCKGQPCVTCEFQDISKNCYTAKTLYNAGYRKQSEGEWIDRDGKTWCSLCQASNKQYKPPFCPHCGAKMKGE